MLAALATLASACLAPAAGAAKPERVRVGPFEPHVDPPGVACPVEIAPAGVRFAYAGGNQAMTTFDDGRFMFTGRYSEEVTNVATGKSVVEDFGGSDKFFPQPDGSVTLQLRGRTGFGFFPGDVGPGDNTTGRAYIFTGHLQVVFDANGSVIAFTSTGTMQDVCAMIA